MSMKIDYKKFNEYSEKSQLRIITFAKLLLNLIEMRGEKKFPSTFFSRDGFELGEITPLTEKINEILDIGVLAWDKGSYVSYVGGEYRNKILITNVCLEYKKDALKVINLFLNEVSKNNDVKILPKSLKGCNIEFNDSLAKIIIDGNDIPLPAYCKEHYFARALFKRKKR